MEKRKMKNKEFIKKVFTIMIDKIIEDNIKLLKALSNTDKKGIRPTPILKGSVASRFYKDINIKELSKEQEAFIQYCASVFDDLTQEEKEDDKIYKIYNPVTGGYYTIRQKIDSNKPKVKSLWKSKSLLQNLKGRNKKMELNKQTALQYSMQKFNGRKKIDKEWIDKYFKLRPDPYKMADGIYIHIFDVDTCIVEIKDKGWFNVYDYRGWYKRRDEIIIIGSRTVNHINVKTKEMEEHYY